MNEEEKDDRSLELRKRIAAELRWRNDMLIATLPPSAIWHGKHKPYGKWNETIDYPKK